MPVVPRGGRLRRCTHILGCMEISLGWKKDEAVTGFAVKGEQARGDGPKGLHMWLHWGG